MPVRAAGGAGVSNAPQGSNSKSYQHIRVGISPAGPRGTCVASTPYGSGKRAREAATGWLPWENCAVSRRTQMTCRANRRRTERARLSWLFPSLIALVVIAGCQAAESRDQPGGERISAADGSTPESGPEAPSTTSADPEAPRTSATSEAEPAPAVPRPEPAAAPQPEPATAPRPEPEPAAVFVSEGTRMTLRLAERLSTNDNQAGDMFWAIVAADVRSSNGDLLVPAGTPSRGTVIQSQESRGADEPPVLALRLVTLELDGASLPLDATIVEAESKSDTRDSGGETAAKIGVGAAAGALVGGLIGKDTKGALIGAGAGAAAGTVFAVTTKDGHAHIDEGRDDRDRARPAVAGSLRA